ncbi:3-deoxy-7-phosphoheptulonate synthase [Candidatus Woesearchaeota archaeon]|nr:3-deoxy-7-phosphoheptulonate synthase [Candidatus Woesearchaeota archaeon]
MIIVMKRNAEKSLADRVIDKIESLDLKPVPLFGTERTVIAVIGDTRKIQKESMSALPGVDKVMSVVTPFKLTSRDTQKEDSVIKVNGTRIGGGTFTLMAGPCAVEGEDMLLETARKVKSGGASLLRGGAYKPRTSPYSFQGHGEKGLAILQNAKNETGLPVITELMEIADLKHVEQYADIIQIGTRNMHNFRLLKAVGMSKKPVMLKRGMSATFKEFLMSAEYIMKEGNQNVILCERGIRTFSDYSRNTLDLSIVPMLKKVSHLPVIVDPSHGTGKTELVLPMAKAAIAAGADGIMIEVHPNPADAVSDGDQSLNFEQFDNFMEEIKPYVQLAGLKMQ